jgi:dihydrofolate reductase
MALIRLYMTMSLDGYVTGPQDSVDAPMGIDGFRLFNWLDRRNDPGPSGQVFTELMATRAVIAGRRTYELAGRWQGDHHDGVPVFVLTHDVPDDPPPGSSTSWNCTSYRSCSGRGDGCSTTCRRSTSSSTWSAD